MTYWRGKSAAALGRAIGDREISPIWLVEDYLAAIHAQPEADRIYARLTGERALAEAAAAERRAHAGLRLSPLDGVPVSWKDNIDSAGIATEAGSRLLQGRTPERDATVLAAASAQGLVCLGKTHMTELAFSGLGVNPVTATPPNVNDPALAPGGSSSGAAASVAFDLAAAAIGTDTGGSIRVPAAWNNLVGLKPTHGRMAMTGILPLAEKFDAVGPLARTVEDAALLFAALEGRRAPDLGGTSLSRARLLILDTIALEGCRAAPLAAFEDAVARLKDAGAEVRNGRIPELAEAADLAHNLFTSEAYGIWKDEVEAAPELMFAPILERFRTGATYSAVDYVAAWRKLNAIRQIWRERTAGYDAVIIPSAAILPPDTDRLLSDSRYYATENLLALRNARIANLMGLCALTLPTAHPAAGIMFLGRPMTEEALLRLGAAAEPVLTA